MPTTANQPRTKFKTPEGRYNLVAESQSRHPFHFLRQTRLTIASLASIGGTDEDGLYAVYSVGDGCLHLARYNATHKEPLRSLALGNLGARSNALISCHDFLPGAKDGVDTLVGMSDGQVFLLSLRAQLQAPMNSKVALAAMLLPDNTGEGARCCGVLWLPHTNGHFLAAYTTGIILVYKKGAVVNEGSSKFSLSIGAQNKPPAPTSTITVAGGGINDVAVCPAPTGFIAAACRDGAVRIMSASSGQVVGGFHSYYGAMLCCCFSHDGRYLAAGGEDDLVGVYSMAERAPVAHCQGHQSWVSRVRFDSWLEVAPPSVTGLAGSHAGQSTASEDAQIYRVASVGQDARLCIWDVQMVPTEGEVMATPVAGTGMRKSASVQKLEMGRKASGDLLMMLQQQPPVISSAAPSHQRKPSNATNKTGVTKGTVLPSMSYFDMNIVLPICEHRLHVEPISDVQFTENLILTADHSGQIRTWARPPKDELMRRSLGPQCHG